MNVIIRSNATRRQKVRREADIVPQIVWRLSSRINALWLDDSNVDRLLSIKFTQWTLLLLIVNSIGSDDNRGSLVAKNRRSTLVAISTICLTRFTACTADTAVVTVRPPSTSTLRCTSGCCAHRHRHWLIRRRRHYQHNRLVEISRESYDILAYERCPNYNSDIKTAKT